MEWETTESGIEYICAEKEDRNKWNICQRNAMTRLQRSCTI